MLRSGDGRPIEVLSAKLSEGAEAKEKKSEGLVEIKKLAEGRWQLKVAVVPDSLSLGSAMLIETSCKGQSMLRVPLLVR